MTTEVATAATTLHLTRTFDAPCERVFRAWTDPALLARWWWPASFATTYAIDLRPGGQLQHPLGGPPRPWRAGDRRHLPRDRPAGTARLHLAQGRDRRGGDARHGRVPAARRPDRDRPHPRTPPRRALTRQPSPRLAELPRPPGAGIRREPTAVMMSTRSCIGRTGAYHPARCVPQSNLASPEPITATTGSPARARRAPSQRGERARIRAQYADDHHRPPFGRHIDNAALTPAATAAAILAPIGSPTTA